MLKTTNMIINFFTFILIFSCCQKTLFLSSFPIFVSKSFCLHSQLCCSVSIFIPQFTFHFSHYLTIPTVIVILVGFFFVFVFDDEQEEDISSCFCSLPSRLSLFFLGFTKINAKNRK